MPDKVDESDEFFRISEDLVQLPVTKTPVTSIVNFDGNNALLVPPLRLHQDLTQGCGGQLWPAGMVLAKYMLLNHRDSLRGQTIVELGAGGGLVGLAVALGCTGFQPPIHITDQESMRALMHGNVELNGLSDTVRPAVYNWGEPPPDEFPAHPDVVLAADCVYFEPAFPLLQKTLQDLIGRDTVCYFCFKKRRKADLHFVKAIKKIFDVKEIEDDPGKNEYSKESIFLFKIQQKR